MKRTPVTLAEIGLIDIPEIIDARGKLIHAEIDQVLPFIARRFFVIYDVPDTEVRGQHAHRELIEFVVAVKGSVKVEIDDGHEKKQFVLDSPKKGLIIPPRFWRSLYEYTSDAILIVAASTKYNADDYIRDYDDYLAMISRAS